MFSNPFDTGDAAMGRLLRDLTAEARAGRLEPVCCRDEEIARVVDILLRQSKNNPALVGPAGVGKTAIAEGLAQRVAAGDVPLALRDTRVLALDHVGLLAGTMYRGQYEERLRALVETVTRDPRIVLFIDELHNLIGQGTAMGAAMDAANMLKPALVRGDFRVIGATTSDEYDRWVRGDPALERRFQKIAVRELAAEQAMVVLEARRERMERHHNVAIADDALLAAVRLSDMFVTDRARPDRAIDALDEACAHVQARAIFTPATEALVLERRELARRAEGERAAPAAERAEEPRGVAYDEDPLERFARDGVAALERLSADIEAALAGRAAPPQGAPAPEAATPRPERPPPRQAPEAAPVRLARIDLELRRRLMDEGIVVRGHDVARVISAATGQRVEWKS